MDPLIDLIDRWHPLAAQAEDNPNDADAQIAADTARRELELRLVTLESFLTGLHHGGARGAYRALHYVAGTEGRDRGSGAPE